MLDSLKQKKNFQRIKMRIKTGDLVKVINGQEKGKTGEVLKTIPLENRVVVKGINLRTKHVKPTQEGETGRILTEEASLHASNVMFFSKEKNLTSKIEFFIDKEGVKKRRLKKTGEVLKTIPLENRVVVKGINLRTKHVKPTQEGETGRILTEEASLHASNVMFFSKDKNLTSKIEYFIDKEGVKKRRLKKTGEVID